MDGACDSAAGCVWRELLQQPDALACRKASRPRPHRRPTRLPPPPTHHHRPGDYADGAEGGIQGVVELPPAEMGRLEEIAHALVHVPPMQRERVAQQLMAPGYLRTLLDLFRQAEDLEDAPSLAALFQALRAAVLLNDTALLEELLREEHVMGVMGALEYDPETPGGARAQHRRFLQEAVVFKQVVPIDNQEVRRVGFACGACRASTCSSQQQPQATQLRTDPSPVHPTPAPQTLAKIHQTYRIQYLKDVVLPRCLDDATYATLTSLTLFNNVDVLSALQVDARFLPRLFGALKEARPDTPEWGDLVAFLQVRGGCGGGVIPWRCGRVAGDKQRTLWGRRLYKRHNRNHPSRSPPRPQSPPPAQELCSLSKHLQLTQRQALWSKMQQLGLFEVLTKVIAAGATPVKLRATDILLSTLGHDPLPLRGFLTRQPGHELLGLLVREMLGAADDSGLPEQIAELLKVGVGWGGLYCGWCCGAILTGASHHPTTNRL
jgi:protein phosphatase-4 regulatory subunit 3